MIENNPTNVPAAFEMLLEEIEAEIDFQERLGAKAFERHDHDTARKAADRAVQALAFKDKVASLHKEWESSALSHTGHDEGALTDTQKRDLDEHLPRGSGTPQSAYRQPILQALVEMGGAARMSDVLTRVEQLMRGRLKKVDYDPLRSDGMLRWSKSAQWTRNRMAREGLLKSDSPRGIWEISEAGRKALLKESH